MPVAPWSTAPLLRAVFHLVGPESVQPPRNVTWVSPMTHENGMKREDRLLHTKGAGSQVIEMHGWELAGGALWPRRSRCVVAAARPSAPRAGRDEPDPAIAGHWRSVVMDGYEAPDSDANQVGTDVMSRRP